MTLIRDTVRGAIWTISTSIGSRIVGLIGTVLVTRFVTPHEYGQVAVAAVLVMTANQLSTLGLGQYLVARPDASRAAAFHATVFHVTLGAAALALLLGIGDRFAPALSAPEIGRFLPGLVLAALLDRVAYVPQRILARDLRFGALGGLRTAGDLAYSVTSVGLAWSGWGAIAIVWGNVARSLVALVLSVLSVRRLDWLAPCRLSLTQARELLSFGIPISIGALAAFAARRWDNLLVSHFFGPATAGRYVLAYNLADVPAIQVGEQIGDVLLPSFARLPPERRTPALIRSLRLLSLCVFPLAVGLGAVAPTLVATLFDPRWHDVAPMLMLLSALSIARPVAWTVASYLLARRYPRTLMLLELGKLAALTALITWAGSRNPLLTSAAVGLAFGAHMLVSLIAVRRIDGVSLRASLGSLWPALVCCGPMVGAVLVARYGLPSAVAPALRLVIEVSAGALAYVAATFVFAPEPARDLVTRFREALGREAS